MFGSADENTVAETFEKPEIYFEKFNNSEWDMDLSIGLENAFMSKGDNNGRAIFTMISLFIHICISEVITLFIFWMLGRLIYGKDFDKHWNNANKIRRRRRR